MGNGQSSTDARDVLWRIDLDHEKTSTTSNQQQAAPSDQTDFCIQAGTTLKGSVKIRVMKPIAYEPMYLRLTGMEMITFARGSAEAQRKPTSEKFLCASNVKLCGLEPENFPGGTLAPVTYIFPFEIKLPSTLPSSMCGILDGGGDIWDIRYRLAVKRGTPKRGVPRPTLFEKYFKVASSPLPNELIPAVIMPEAHNVESLFGLRDRGSIVIAARVRDVHVGRGENLFVYLAARNNATASIQSVEIELLEEVTCRKKDDEKKSTTVVTRLQDVDVPGIQKQKLSHQSSVDRMNDVYKELSKQIKSKKNRAKLKVPYECKDSYKGKLFQVKHCLKITMHTNARITNPSIEVPLRIGFPPQVKKKSKKKKKKHHRKARTRRTNDRNDTSTDAVSHDATGNPQTTPSDNTLPSPIPPPMPQDDNLPTPIPPPVDPPAPSLPVAQPEPEPEIRVSPEPIEVAGDDHESHASSSEEEEIDLPNPIQSTIVSNTESDDDDDDDEEEEEEEDIPVARMVNIASIRSIPCTTIPVVEATLIAPEDASAVYAYLASAPGEDIVVGGHLFSSLTSNPDSTVAPSAPIDPPSSSDLSSILQEMSLSLDDYEIISNHLATTSFLENISAEDFGQILAHVNIESEKTRVATLLACRLGTKFTSFYVREAARNCASWDRVTIVPRLMPFCSDLPDNMDVIRNELLSWERQYIQEQVNL